MENISSAFSILHSSNQPSIYLGSTLQLHHLCSSLVLVQSIVYNYYRLYQAKIYNKVLHWRVRVGVALFCARRKGSACFTGQARRRRGGEDDEGMKTNQDSGGDGDRAARTEEHAIFYSGPRWRSTRRCAATAVLRGAVVQARSSSGDDSRGRRAPTARGAARICPAWERRRMDRRWGSGTPLSTSSSLLHGGGSGQRDPAFIIVHQRGILQAGTDEKVPSAAVIEGGKSSAPLGEVAMAFNSTAVDRPAFFVHHGVHERGTRGLEALHRGGEKASSFI